MWLRSNRAKVLQWLLVGATLLGLFSVALPSGVETLRPSNNHKNFHPVAHQPCSKAPTYDVDIRRVVDADTIDAEIFLGFDVYTRQRLRLYGLNAPEMRGPEREAGRRSTLWVRSALAGRPVRVRTVKTPKGAEKRGKYGRFLAWIEYRDRGGKWHDLNRELLEKGLAKAAHY